MSSRDILRLTCLNCGKEFYRPRFQHDRNVKLGRRGPFCSKACGHFDKQSQPMTVERFWSLVDQTGECWLWTGARNSWGYGHFKAETRNHIAHRWIYEATVGPIPDGLELDHLCANAGCVRPDHLEAVTHAENMRRRAARMAR